MLDAALRSRLRLPLIAAPMLRVSGPALVADVATLRHAEDRKSVV